MAVSKFREDSNGASVRLPRLPRQDWMSEEIVLFPRAWIKVGGQNPSQVHVLTDVSEIQSVPIAKLSSITRARAKKPALFWLGLLPFFCYVPL